ncbi:MAG: hypothetical protein O3A96_03985, partial [Proteobacteria bacterium]|nr:hypothetical protein [Pseudomonadota bacterium]
MTTPPGSYARRVAVLCLSIFLFVAARTPAAEAAEDIDPAATHQTALTLTLFSQVCAEKIGRPYEAQAALEALPVTLASIAGEDLPLLPVEPGATVKAWAVASPTGPVLVALIDSYRCVVQAEPVDGPRTREMLGTIVRGIPAPLTLEQHELRNVAMGEQQAVQEYWVLGGLEDGVKPGFPMWAPPTRLIVTQHRSTGNPTAFGNGGHADIVGLRADWS